MAKLGLPPRRTKLKSATELIIQNRIEQKQGEVEELRELQRDLQESETLGESKVWKVLERLWK